MPDILLRKLNEIKILWGVNMKSGIGNQYGYFIHNSKLREALSKLVNLEHKKGEKITDAVFIVSPEFFKGKIDNVNTWLFTMFEGNSIPDVYYNQMKKADYLLAPSTWVKSTFDKYFDPDKTFVVNHGVSEKFTYKKRRFPRNKPFRFLWVGAPNPRKGYEEVIVVWKAIFEKIKRVELYIKTTLVGKLSQKENVILDGRKLSTSDLINLYHSAHCFLFPTRGEGFGLTLAEAMRTGLPCIATDYSGHKDFFDDTVGYPIDYQLREGKVTFIGEQNEACRYEKTIIAYPDTEQLAHKMIDIVNNYNYALRLGFKAHQKIKDFTWSKSAETLLTHMQKVPHDRL